jgi:glutamate carboxypeptidase
MKGGLVVGLYALRALDAFGLLEGLPVAFIFNSDEEIGSHESAALIQDEAQKSLFALVFECSGMDGGTVTGRKGKRTYGMDLSGRAGHAGNLTGPKPSAIVELAQKTLALEALNNPERGITVNVGRIEGGTGPNTIPGWATAQVDTRYATQADGDALHRAVTGLCAKSGVPGTSCETHIISARPAMEQTPANRELLSMAQTQGGLLGVPVVEEFRGGVSDANLISHAGVPVLDGLGPAGEFDHSHDEYMIVSSLAGRAALTALLTAEAFKRLQNA